MVNQIEQSISRALLETHRELLSEIIELARSVSRRRSRDCAASERIVNPLRARLEQRGLLEGLLDVLATGVAETDGQMGADPVAAPPYVVVTSRGPMCRGSLTDGRRLVVLLELFAIERRPRVYRFRDPTPAECLTVRIRSEKG